MSKCLEENKVRKTLGWQFSAGIGGSFQTEWVATFTGLGGNFAPEYAVKLAKLQTWCKTAKLRIVEPSASTSEVEIYAIYEDK